MIKLCPLSIDRASLILVLFPVLILTMCRAVNIENILQTDWIVHHGQETILVFFSQ